VGTAAAVVVVRVAAVAAPSDADREPTLVTTGPSGPFSLPRAGLSRPHNSTILE
jgi:hypothetical protein